MKNKKEQNITVLEKDNCPKYFTDFIQMSINNETVKMKLGVKTEESEGNTMTEISSTVIMTLPHFLRFAEMCNNAASKIIDEYKD
ncbi:hypothetical protein [Myroides odoratimimus]|uniref:hypothetical protein n=1 Tax=Myroides odoratimimus TaxID=76832 RepID=UPI000469E58C|nr:hypothetical protein [Myroides odoratimimus]